MKKSLLVALLFFLSISSFEAYSQNGDDNSKNKFGLGIGLDYGGFGARLSYLPIKNFALFGALGYNLVGAGYNAGGTFRILPDKKFCPTISGMYGYVAAIKIEGAGYYNKIYYGPSISLGLEIKGRKRPKNFWNFELIAPFRSQEYKDDIDDLKNNSNIKMSSEPTPIGYSVGYHCGF